MKDQLVKGQFKGLDIALSCAVTTQAVNEMVLQHACDPASAHLFGRAVTSALLSAAILPEKQRINVCWKYQGLVRTIVVDAGSDGTVRGFISPAQLNLENDSSTALYGDLGQLQVVTSQEGKILNSGTTPIPLQDVTKDLAYAHCISDQIETGMTALIFFNADPQNPVRLCRGWMIQALPNTDLERFDRIRRRMSDADFRDGLAKNSSDDELAALLVAHEPDFAGIHQEIGPAPRVTCSCSREKMEAVVRTLPIPERMEIVQKKENIAINCQFCNKRYELTIDDCIVAWNRKLTD